MDQVMGLVNDITNQIMTYLTNASPLQLVVLANAAYLGINLLGWLHGVWQKRLTVILLAVDVWIWVNLISYGH